MHAKPGPFRLNEQCFQRVLLVNSNDSVCGAKATSVMITYKWVMTHR